MIAESEDGEVQRVTYGELEARVNQLANALLELGVAAGQTVGLYLPMGLEVVVAFYAVCKIGAIAVPIFSGFAATALAARLADADVIALITADAVPRRGRPMAMKQTADEALATVPGVRHVIVSDRLGTDPPMQAGRDHHWRDLVDRQGTQLDAPALDPETPMMVIYTSGTTGRPKGAVHVHGGFLVKIAEECAFQCDVHPDDIFTWMTDMGWIMGPLIVVGAGALGATLFVSEGAPDYPDPGRMWQLVERHRIIVPGGLTDRWSGRSSRTATSSSPRTTAHRCGCWARPANRGTPSPTAGCSRSAARPAARSSTWPAAPRWARASCLRCP